ncbi:NAD(P)/FAD-dependent oxidoreductase [Salinicoccus kekensis]|uniref:NAD(P)/FAD-dependent oxidoreductase n=1 Tax=Salinicoccus kekensis TaxID=714307 RepID=UPI000BE45FEC|nr:FAD-dependent oxidoreductase [Salinicoccus kekensis]
MGIIKFDVVTVGAGVMGLSIANALAKKGLKVAVIDRDAPGMHASWKAGGMLGAQNEFSDDSPLFRLAKASRRYFEPLAAELLETTGIDIEYMETGLIKMADSKGSRAALHRQFQFLKGHNDNVKAVNEKDILDLGNQFITPGEHFAMHIPDDGQVNANKYTKALTASALHHGVTRISRTEVISIHREGQDYRLKTSTGDIHASKVAVTAGAWSQSLLAPFRIESSVTGVKGEIMLLEQPEVRLKHTLFMTNGFYIIPKRNHRFLVGATSRFGDFSSGMTKDGETWLWMEILKHMPRLKSADVLMKSSGVRPYTPTETPVMDEVENGLFVVSGHYRNGILLSPATGILMSEWITEGRRPAILNEFTIERRSKDAMHHQ